MSGAPTENNIMLWNAVIFGPHETPFEVGIGYNDDAVTLCTPSTPGVVCDRVNIKLVLKLLTRVWGQGMTISIV